MYDRTKTIGASDAVMIHEGKWAELYDRKTSSDAPSYPLPAAIGHALEPLNRTWFTQETGLPIHYEEEWAESPMTSEEADWLRYLPDGLIEGCIPFEAKAVNPFWKEHRLIAKYTPQLQHAMRVSQADYCYLSVFYLNSRFEYYKIDYDPIFSDELFRQEQLFHWFLENQTRPPE